VARRALGGGEHVLGLRERGGDRLLDEHVPARLDRGAGEAAVVVHAREHQDRVDVRVLVDGRLIRQVGREVQAGGGEAALLGVGVVDRRDLDPSLAAQALDQAHVRRPEDAAAPEDAEPDRHRGALRAVS
jgi:hypothetical protein